MISGCVYWIHLPEQENIKKEGYVGITTKGFKKRINDHKSLAKKNYKKSGKLGAAIRKYTNRLIYEIVCIGTPEYCLEIENRLRPIALIGWNLGIGGAKTTLGRKCTQEQREHFSKVHTGRTHTEEWKKMMSERHKGKKFRLGGKMPESAKEKIRNAKATCPNCLRTMTIPMIVRWHGDKCKTKEIAVCAP
jgi:hypothetical protein